MKECFAITTYCNSEDKIRILNKTIDNLKQFNIDIIIHAHYPLSDEIQKKTDFYFYSSDNPVLPRYNMWWYDIDKYRLEYKNNDYSYTVMKQWKEVMYIMPKYDVIHFLNYDANITTELYNMTKNYIELNNKSVFYENFISPGMIHLIYFSILSKDYYYMISILDKDEFLLFPSSSNILPSLEEYMTNKITMNTDFGIIPFHEYDMLVDEFLENEINQVLFTGSERNKIPYKKMDNGFYMASDLGKFLFTFRKKYNIFIGYFNNELSVIIYDLKEELQIEINNMNYIISKNTEYFLFKITNDSFKINNEIIGKNIIDEFINLDCKIYIKNN